MNAYNVVREVRRIMNDKEPFAFTNETLIIYIDQAQKTLLRLRPDLLLGDDGSLDSITDVTPKEWGGLGNQTELVVDDKWLSALANYVCSRLYREDADNNDETKADRHMASFYAAVQTGV